MIAATSVPVVPAVSDLAPPFVSHACEFPADQQAELIRAHMTRRHPWVAARPTYSGYCMPQLPCECECHQAQPGELAGEVFLDAFET